MRDALTELKKWSRKYYTCTMNYGPHIQPGDGFNITLSNGWRKVCVDGYDLPPIPDPNDPEEIAHGDDRDMGEIILFAIDQWHADSSLKKFRVLIWGLDKTSLKTDNSRILSKEDHLGGRSVWLHTVVRNEAEALELARSKVVNPELATFYVWEREAWSLTQTSKPNLAPTPLVEINL